MGVGVGVGTGVGVGVGAGVGVGVGEGVGEGVGLGVGDGVGDAAGLGTPVLDGVLVGLGSGAVSLGVAADESFAGSATAPDKRPDGFNNLAESSMLGNPNTTLVMMTTKASAVQIRHPLRVFLALRLSSGLTGCDGIDPFLS